MSTLLEPEVDRTPWRRRDPVSFYQNLGVHLGTPLLAAIVTVLSPMSGYSGFLVTWFPLHIAAAALLGKFGSKRKSFANSTIEVLMSFALIVFTLFIGSLIWPIISNGVKAFNLNLLTSDAADVAVDAPLTQGGLLQAILGSVMIVGIATAISVPVGVLAALYVTEVRGRLTPFVRFFVQAMSGVPSVVAGLFIYAALIVSGHMTYSGLAGALSLSILMLPTVARTAEEILRLIEDDLRTAALALGATQWRAVRMVVLPAARSGLITAAILGVARVIGETAPLLLTAFGSKQINLNPVEGPMAALPTYVFQQMALGTENDMARAWFACLVLLIIVATMFIGARVVAKRMKQV